MLKKIKLISLLLLLFLVSGCSATYVLDIKSGEVNESLYINNYDKETWDSYKERINIAAGGAVATNYLEDEPEVNEKTEGINYYNIKRIEHLDNVGVSYQNIFNKEEYKNSNIIFMNTSDFDYSYNADKIKINIKNIEAFKFHPDLKELTVKLTTNHEVLNTNANEIKDNTYFWYLNKNNIEEKTINIELSSKIVEKKLGFLEADEEGYFGKSTLVVIYYIIGIIILLVGIVVFMKVKKSNK